MSVRSLIRADAARFLPEGASLLRQARLALTCPPFRAAVLYRLSHRAGGAVGRLLASVNLSIHSVDIDPRADIGPGLLLQHPVGVVIGGGARIGSRCTLMSGVVLGRREVLTGPDALGYPQIGDDVLLGATSVILGPVRVGTGASVGANSVVLRDVPAHTTAAGSPATLVTRNSQEKQNVG